MMPTENIEFSYLSDISFGVSWKNALPIMHGKHLIKPYTWNTRNFQQNYRLNFSANAQFSQNKAQ